MILQTAFFQHFKVIFVLVITFFSRMFYGVVPDRRDHGPVFDR